MTQPPKDSLLEATILAQAEAVGPEKSICPSEVARALAPEDWRPLMTATRRAAMRLQAAGRIAILRKGKPVTAEDVRGVIRLRIIP
ncbi:DUF3253 domain-containing protein [Plastoroseomonas arctica]|uniref:DUF3253 domain-containing protein n=1 Tax=Plastoroseomonas arctica TaxID=1509237 RepID=A0AAF1KR05_9PROT|nr:DUF3253 domain-containing protein [Plastoroseomonas arctica]MBR0653742.1 DUF3253 domain-containing protein [Plastoroseomonas arctica]